MSTINMNPKTLLKGVGLPAGVDPMASIRAVAAARDPEKSPALAVPLQGEIAKVMALLGPLAGTMGGGAPTAAGAASVAAPVPHGVAMPSFPGVSSPMAAPTGAPSAGG